MAWRFLSQEQKKEVLKELFLVVLLEQENLPPFIDDEDIELFRRCNVEFSPHFNSFSVVMNIEPFAYKYWFNEGDRRFLVLTDFLKDTVAEVRISHLKLFHDIVYEYGNMRMHLKFNIDAVRSLYD